VDSNKNKEHAPADRGAPQHTKKKLARRGRLTDELADGDLLVERALQRALVLPEAQRLADPEQLARRATQSTPDPDTDLEAEGGHS
jgi:hypothetical protein